LHSILEADEDEDNEEAGDMNDNELNVLIARSEEEGMLFRQLDIDRERDAEDNWRAHGPRGKHPAALMQLEKLPDCGKNDEVFEVQEMDDIAEG
jgi:ATP-dependent helicase STH1/SNF2